MKFTETELAGAWFVDVEPHSDERGFFARTWCRREFEEHGIDSGFVQASVSYNRVAGTLRGMHFQRAPHDETKLVRCASGAIYDVIVDLRRESETYGRWLGVELSAANRRALLVPKGFAHGFITLADNSEVFYQISEFYTPGHAGGLRYDDPALGIEWPVPVRVINDKDRSWPDFASLADDA
jgi:dTDP-4-dehydrorhamnose 3,5-epimerase